MYGSFDVKGTATTTKRLFFIASGDSNFLFFDYHIFCEIFLFLKENFTY